MKIEEHENALKEHLNAIKRCINEGISENQRNIAYNISQGGVEILSIYLLKMNLSTPADKWDHRIFKKSDATKRLPDFPKKSKILKLMKIIEEKRNTLIYGKRKSESEIEKIIIAFNSLRKIIGEENG